MGTTYSLHSFVTTLLEAAVFRAQRVSNIRSPIYFCDISYVHRRGRPYDDLFASLSGVDMQGSYLSLLRVFVMFKWNLCLYLGYSWMFFSIPSSIFKTYFWVESFFAAMLASMLYLLEAGRTWRPLLPQKYSFVTCTKHSRLMIPFSSVTLNCSLHYSRLFRLPHLQCKSISLVIK